MEISTKLMELYQEKIEGLLGNGIAPYFYKVIQNKDASPNEILFTVCFFDSFLEHCSMNVNNIRLIIISLVLLEGCWWDH